MKDNPDINDILREEGEDAARQRHDNAHKYKSKFNGHNATGDKPDEPLPFVDMRGWDKNPPPARQWWVEGRIPLRQPTLLSGEGAVGKSILVLQLLVSTALGLKWLDMHEPAPGPVIYLGAEDEQDELHRRLAAILKYHNRKFAVLIEARFKMLAYAGEDAVLAEFDRNGRIRPTKLYERLHREACILRPRGIAIDTVSDVFLGDEIKRDQVRQFGTLLRRLAIDSNSGVLLTSHPSLAGMRTGTGLSGSTQWHNSVRARAYFIHPKSGEEGESDDNVDDTPDDRRELQFLKNQYGPLGARIRLRWADGLWLPLSPEAAAEYDVEELFLRLLRGFAEQGRNVGDKRGTSYAPAQFASDPEAKKAKVSKKALADAMARLFAMNRIKVLTEGPPSRQRSRIVAVGEDPSREAPQEHSSDASHDPPQEPSPGPSTNQLEAFHQPSTDGATHPPYNPPPGGRAPGAVEGAPVPPGGCTIGGSPQGGTQTPESVAPTPSVPSNPSSRNKKPRLRAVGPTDQPCAVCYQSGGVMLIADDGVVGAKAEPLHPGECAESWFCEGDPGRAKGPLSLRTLRTLASAYAAQAEDGSDRAVLDAQLREDLADIVSRDRLETEFARVKALVDAEIETRSESGIEFEA